MPITEDRWLSERFGHHVFTVTADERPDAVLEHAAEAGAASYQARVPAGRTDAVTALTDAGFAVVNETITLARETGPLDPGPEEIDVRIAIPETDGVVLDIAERGFTKSRFHLDPGIPGPVANRIKRDWAENSLIGGRGDGMLVAVRNGTLVGFLAGMASEDGGRRARIIDLIAVEEEVRDSGVGRALMAQFAADSTGFDELWVGTQAANPGATRFYERLGFTTSSASFDLHLHAGDPWA